MASSSLSPPSRNISSSSSAMTYPCLLEVNVANFVPIKLIGQKNYSVWKQLMLDLIVSHRLVGFVDGTIQPLEEEKTNEEEYWSWKRSDGLVRGWILVTVIEEILLKLVGLKTAREVWIQLEKMFSVERTTEDRSATTDISRYLPLHKAILQGDWKNATEFLEKEPNGARDAISVSKTALMVAVRSSKRDRIVKKLIEIMSPEDVARRDTDGATALYMAVGSNNNKAAKLLVEKYRELPSIGKEDGTLPVNLAARQGNKKMVNYLLPATNVIKEDGKLGLRLLTDLAFGGLHDIASTFLQCYPKLASMEPSPLEEMVHHSSFHIRAGFNLFQLSIYSCIPVKLAGNVNNKPGGRDIENSAEGVVSPLGHNLREKLHAMFWKVAGKLVPPIKFVRKTKLIHHEALNFVKQYCEEVVKCNFSKANGIFRAPLLEAASCGAFEIVEEILASFPDGIYFQNEKRQFIFHLAIENRDENLFNLLYQVEGRQTWFLSGHDESGNNALHTAGNFASRQQLTLRASVAGTALQMQRELQWYTAVEKLIHPQAKYETNKEGKTPQDIFTDTHKDLVERGEKWMKDTASSCSIVAALIVTVVFAAAITVPGGLKGDTGTPIFLERTSFTVFGVFDALGLLFSTTSLLMFLSIFTSRYGEREFLYALPKKLIVGLVTLYFSILFMMIAFALTLKIVFRYNKSFIPVLVLSYVPVTLFALLQLPLLIRMIKSTYYPHTFRKRSKRILF